MAEEQPKETKLNKTQQEIIEKVAKEVVEDFKKKI